MIKKFKDVMEKENIEMIVIITAIVAALGYMVDIFDLLLFSIVRMQSLKDLGVAQENLLSSGVHLMNAQMLGLMIGGILWGVLGDKRGRLSVLFGSILIYSVANIANGFVQTVEQYSVLRFIAGVGLAGELGAGVTLASELLPKHLRGLATTFIASVGMIGAVMAALIAEYAGWRMAYMIGGCMGLLLLVLRMNVKESGMYKKVIEYKTAGKKVSHGNILMLFNDFSRFRRYIAVILVGAPLWCVVGLFITFSPEFAKAFGMVDLPKAGNAVLFCYAGLLVGDLFSGLLSQKLKSRKKAVGVFMFLTTVFSLIYVSIPYQSVSAYYSMCFMLGIGTGYWAMFVQMGAEQFGTNIRSTAATTIPNMVRGLTVPMASGFQYMIPTLGVVHSGLTVFFITMFFATISLISLKDTFETDLDYFEEY